MYPVIPIAIISIWAWVWGWFSHDSGGFKEGLTGALWPILFPAGFAYHWWVWGTLWGDIGTRRHVYTDRRWWQRGDREMRPLDWNNK